MRDKRLWLWTGIISAVLSMVIPVAAQGNGVAQETVMALWERVQTTLTLDPVRAVLIIGGITMLLIGWRIYNFVILLAGALTGAVFMVSVLAVDDPTLVIALMIVGAILGAIFAALLYYVAVFTIGAYTGAMLAIQAVAAFELNVAAWVALIFGGLMGGLILLGLSFELLVILASIVGAQMIALGLGLSVMWTLVLIVVGIILQIMLSRVLGYRIRRRPSRRMLFREA